MRSFSPLAAVAALSLATVGTVGTVAAQALGEPSNPYAPATLSAPRLTLRQAIELALTNDPALLAARERVAASRGSLLLASGPFDTVLTAAPALTHETTVVGSAGMRNQELLRTISREVAITFRAVADDLRRQLDLAGTIPLVNCPPGLIITLDGRSICLSNRERAQWEIIDLLTRRPGLEPERRSVEEATRRLAEQIALILDATALANRNLLRTMGVRATRQDRTSLDLELAASKLYRNGMALSPLLSLSGSKDNYRGKRLAPSFGGKGKLNTFTSIAGLSLEVPLGKGRGEAAAGAAERAARLNLRASLENEAHAVATTALATTLAYYNLTAAQQRLELLSASEVKQASLVAIGEALVAAGELAPADLVAVRARLASTRAAVAQAHQAVAEARITLAQAMGVAVEDIAQAPVAAEGFPPPPSPAELDGFRAQQRAQQALTRRADVKAARQLEESARQLAEAARLDLRRASTLSFQVWYQGLWEGRSPRDMRNVLVGYQRALFGGQVGPSARLAITVEWPFANQVAQGRYGELRALYHSSGIQTRNLERVLSTRVEELSGAAEKARAELVRSQEAVRAYEELIAVEVERFRLGEATAADVVLTEENRVAAGLALVAAEQRLATAVAQLRFELGGLVRYSINDNRVVVDEVLPPTS